jgi:hypothetical protein
MFTQTTSKKLYESLMGVFDSKELSTDNVEQFLSMIQFENKGKLDELPIYLAYFSTIFFDFF